MTHEGQGADDFRAEALAEPLGNAGFPAVPGIRSDRPGTDDPGAHDPDAAGDPSQWAKRLHATADPGRPVSVHLRVAGRENWRRAFLVRDWLTADSAARESHAGASSWLATEQAERWAAEAGWSAPEL